MSCRSSGLSGGIEDLIPRETSPTFVFILLKEKLQKTTIIVHMVKKKTTNQFFRKKPPETL
jgi:hypothetical protein